MKKEMILTLLALVGIILVLPNFLSCGKATELIDIVASITGVVRDKTANHPIDSAWIDIADNKPPYSTYTDSTGAYEYSFFIGSNLSTRIFVGRIGYKTFDTLIQFSIPQNNYETINIYLDPE